jgi:hypothetical protein
MKYLLVYKGFCKFKIGWEVIGDYDKITFRVGEGQISSNEMNLINNQYDGYVKEITTQWLWYKVRKVPFNLRILNSAADLCPPASLPDKFHNHTQYLLTYNGVSQDCVIVTHDEYTVLKTLNMIE